MDYLCSKNVLDKVKEGISKDYNRNIFSFGHNHVFQVRYVSQRKIKRIYETVVILLYQLLFTELCNILIEWKSSDNRKTEFWARV